MVQLSSHITEAGRDLFLLHYLPSTALFWSQHIFDTGMGRNKKRGSRGTDGRTERGEVGGGGVKGREELREGRKRGEVGASGGRVGFKHGSLL